MYDKLEDVYTELESIREVLQLELQKDPSDVKKAYLIQRLGNVVIKVLSSKIELVESYDDSQIKDNLLNNLDHKVSLLSAELSMDRNGVR